MIQTKDNLFTEVKFGANGKATISVQPNGNKLKLQMLLAELNIGDSPTPEQIQKLPKIEMEFFDEKSIDIVIKSLEKIRKQIQTNYLHIDYLNQIAMAS